MAEWLIDEKGQLVHPPTNGRGYQKFTAQETYHLWALLTAHLEVIEKAAQREQMKTRKAQTLLIDEPVVYQGPDTSSTRY